MRFHALLILFHSYPSDFLKLKTNKKEVKTSV